jgi:hypothetical protein
MPRTAPVDAPVLVAPRPSLVAAATRVLPLSQQPWRRSEPWQEQCWHYRYTLGEVQYATEWFSNALSRASIMPARYDTEGTLVPIKTGPEVDELRQILGGFGGASQTLKAIGEHLFVAGECYLLGRKPRDADEQLESEDVYWEIVAADLVKKRGEKWTIVYSPTDKYDVQDSDDLFRLHKPSPRNKTAADSSLRAVLPSLYEIEMLSKHVIAQVRSRLASAGILFMSQDVSFSSPLPTAEGTDIPAGLDPFMLTLAQAMAAAIADPDNPTALMPLLARVPGDQVDKQHLLQFWTELDAAVQEMRSAAIRRTALGIDLPPEVLLGTADVNHWGSWQIEESTIKAHIEPALEVICAALTRILRIVLNDPTILCVFDTSALRLRPNRSKEAMELWDRGEINSEALRRETGFSEADDPDEEEREQWYLRKIASGSASPAMVAEALRLLTGIELPVEDETMRESRPDPSLDPLPDYGPPERQTAALDARRAALEATCDATVRRALERAGNKLRNVTTSRPNGIAPDEMHLHVKVKPTTLDHMLDGAWTTLPALLRNQQFSHEKIERALDAYVRALLTEQNQHDPDTMMRFVDAGLSS